MTVPFYLEVHCLLTLTLTLTLTPATLQSVTDNVRVRVRVRVRFKTYPAARAARPPGESRPCPIWRAESGSRCRWHRRGHRRRPGRIRRAVPWSRRMDHP